MRDWMGTAGSMVSALLLVFALGAGQADAAPVTCVGSSAPDCGLEAGDLDCGAGNDCVAVNGGCECRPRICCKCESLNPQGGACDVLPCQDTVLADVFACVLPCFAINDLGVDDCKLSVVNQTTCSDGNCPTDGCCGFSFTAPEQATTNGPGQANTCSYTDSATCSLLGGSFIAGGSCSGNLLSTCVAPTATATPTETATSTPTGTATTTQTPSATPTNTLFPDGQECATPAECASDFCVDNVCCDTACTGEFERCNRRGEEGICGVVTAPAPALSTLALLVGLALITLVGVLALGRRARL